MYITTIEQQVRVTKHDGFWGAVSAPFYAVLEHQDGWGDYPVMGQRGHVDAIMEGPEGWEFNRNGRKISLMSRAELIEYLRRQNFHTQADSMEKAEAVSRASAGL